MALPLLIGTCRIADLIGTPKAAFLQVNPSAPDSATGRAALNSAAPVILGIEITNGGGGVLDWQAHALGGSTWLTIPDSTGTAPDSLFVRLDPQSLTVGAYWDTVVVSATGASGVAQQVPIKFEIHPCDENRILVNDSLVDTLTSADCGAPHRPDHFARIYRFDGTKDDSVSIYMSSGFDGYVALDTSLAPTAPPLVQQDDCVGVTGNPCIVYQRLPATRQYWVEVTSSAPADTGEFTLLVPRPRAPNAPTSLEQRSDSVTIVPPGGTLGQTTITLRALVSDPDLGDSIQIEPEVRPNTTGFNGQPTGPAGAFVANGEVASVTVSVLDNTSYHWRVRAVDNTGKASTVWTAFGGNPDFIVNVPQPPNAPSGLSQSKPDGTPLTVGAVSDTDVVVLSATVTDPDPGDQLRLQVEVKPVGTNFIDSPTDSSPAISSGVAQVSVGPLGNNQNYHWQARTTDQTGRASSPWTKFGGNAESATDFRIQLANVPNAPTALGQFQSNGIDSIPVGGNASFTTVVFKGVVSDPDVGQQVRLDVEYKPVGTTFTDSPTVSSPLVANGSQASVGSLTLSTNVNYHWQARVVDVTNKQGGWVSYGNNPETATDFHVETPPTQLIFLQQPSSAVAGVAIAPAVRVAAADVNGVTVTSFTGAITLTIATNPGGATLFGTTTQNAVAGVATFTDINIQKAANGYTLLASTSGFNKTSTAFNITPAPTSQVVFTGQPSNATAGVAISPAVQVSGEDAFGNLTPTFTGTVTMTIAANPGGGTLGGTTSAAAVGGVAQFGSLSINKSGVGYTLRAASGALTPDTSTTFTINPGPATRVQFTTQPSNTGAGAPIVPAVAVTAFDANANLVTSFSGPVTVAILNNAGGGTLSGTTTVNASGGVATFSNLSIDKSANGYTLQATSGSLTPDTSAAFNILPGQPNLVFTTQPGTTMAGAAINSPGGVVVTARDGLGNTVTTYTNNVTIAIGTNPTGGALGGTTTVAAVGGVATFTNLNINRVGTGYTLLATGTGANSGVSAGFNIIPNVPAVLLFVQQPTNAAANATITPPITVKSQDAYGNDTPAFTSNVTMTIAANPNGGTLGGTTTVAASGGLATFNNLNIDKSGAGYTLRAASGSLTPDTSTAFTITGGTATHLLFTVQPSTDTAGRPIQPAVVVTAYDAGNNVATGFTGNVSMAINSGPVGATLTGTTTVAASGGVATFSNLVLHKIGAHTLVASSSGLSPNPVSNSFNVIPGPAQHLLFTVQPPASTAAGVAMTPAVQVTAQDVDNNTATTFTSNVTVALFDNPNGGVLSGTKTVAAVAGVATFSTLNINKAGPGYTLITTALGLVNDISNTFTIVPGTPTQLVFTVQPSNAAAAANIAPAVQVSVEDAPGNIVTGYVGNVTMAFGSNPSGGTLSGTLTQPVSSGVATFSDLNVNLAGSYTLQATSAGVAGGAPFTSASFNITGGIATQLVFTAQPANSTAGVPINPPTGVRVTARDAQNNTATFSGNVTITIASNPVGGAFTTSSTTTVAAVNGVATFTNLRLNKTGTPYQLQAASVSPALSTTSTGFAISPGGASASLSTVSASPGSITASSSGAPIQSTITVTARDTLGNLIPGATVTFSATGTGNTTTASAVANGSGVATGTLSSTVAEAKTISVTINGVAITQTAPVTVTPAGVSASTSTITRLPTTIAASAGSITSTMTVTAKDQFGNVIPNATVVFGATGTGNTLTPNPPAGSLTNASGVATGTLSSTVAELKVGSSTIDGVLITPTVNITVTPAAATVLLFTKQPGNAAAGATITPGTGVQVEIRDQFSNRVTAATNSILLSILNNAGPGGILSGTNPVAASSGIATFSNLSIDKTGTGYTLLASTAGLTPDTSSAFNITAGVATKLGFFTQPSNTTGGTTFGSAVQVEVQDANGNRVTTASTSITLAIANNPNGGSLSGTTTVSASSGLATFPGISIDSAGSGYTLQASAALPQPTVTSSAFNVAIGTATKLGFRVQPSTTTGGTAISPAIQVEIRDAGGNRVTGASTNVTLAIGTNPKGGHLSGGGSTATSGGVASFNSVAIDSAANGYTLTASSSPLALTGATSNSFNVTAGAASQLVFGQQPTSTTGGATIAPPVTVRILDAGGNQTSSGASVTLAIATNPNSGTLGGTKTVAASGGVATFSTLSIDSAGTGYTLGATSGSLAPATSNAFNINVGSATKLGFRIQPASTTGGATLASVQVEVRDAGGNRVTTGGPHSVALSLSTNPKNGTLSGTTPKATSSGVVSFSDLSIDSAATGYVLQAASSGLSNANSSSFNITVGAPAQLGFHVQPTDEVAGQAISPSIQVEIQDAGGNRVTTASNSVVMTFQANPGSGTLSGTTTQSASSGIATFNDLSIEKAASGYALHAASGGLTPVNSASFTINPGTAVAVFFTTQPTTTTVNGTINQGAGNVVVTARDAFGNTATGFSGNVTVAIGNNAGPGTLNGTLTVAANSGVATFADLSIDTSGTGYTLTASSGALTPDESAAFDIN